MFASGMIVTPTVSALPEVVRTFGGYLQYNTSVKFFQRNLLLRDAVQDMDQRMPSR